MASKYGYTVKKLSAMGPEDISRMTLAELKDAEKVLRDAAAKRLRRLKSTPGGTSSPAYRSTLKTAIERGVPPLSKSSAGLTVNAYRNRIAGELHFLDMKTSTQRGWKRVHEKTLERLADGKKDADVFGYRSNPERAEKIEENFWKAYRKYEEEHAMDKKGTSSRYNSDSVQKAMRKTMGKRLLKPDTILKKFEPIGDTMYESEQERLSELQSAWDI